MSKETIELLKILKDETQSRSVFDRCEAEMRRLSYPGWVFGSYAYGEMKPSRVPGKHHFIRDGEEVRIK